MLQVVVGTPQLLLDQLAFGYVARHRRRADDRAIAIAQRRDADRYVQ
jgi:hypothetical protein